MARRSTQGSKSRSRGTRSRRRSNEEETSPRSRSSRSRSSSAAPKKKAATRSRSACTLAVCKRLVAASEKAPPRRRSGRTMFGPVAPSPEQRAAAIAQREEERYRRSFGPEFYPSRQGRSSFSLPESRGRTMSFVGRDFGGFSRDFGGGFGGSFDRDFDRGRGRGRGRDFGRDEGWFGDREGHSRAARLGWDRHDGVYRGNSRTARRGERLRFDRIEAERKRDFGRDWRGDSEGHRRAALLGWDNHYGVYGGESRSARRGARLRHVSDRDFPGGAGYGFDPDFGGSFDRDFGGSFDRDFDRDRSRGGSRRASGRGRGSYSGVSRSSRSSSSSRGRKSSSSRSRSARPTQKRQLSAKQIAAGFGGKRAQSRSGSSSRSSSSRSGSSLRSRGRSGGSRSSGRGRQLSAAQIAAGFGGKRAQSANRSRRSSSRGRSSSRRDTTYEERRHERWDDFGGRGRRGF